PRALVDIDAPVLDQREPRGVVPAVLEAPQSLEQERCRLPRPRVAYDAAHMRRASSTSSWAPPPPLAPDGASAISRMIGSVFDGRTWSQRSRHAKRRPSCVSAPASGNRRRKAVRSEERRVGKEGGARGRRYDAR